ncbi:MAG: hypothetical protein KDA81_01490 [Planctomycetaceae bacterium]|nr:hypothetical protein [Planctomycetaceae bacterium]
MFSKSMVWATLVVVIAHGTAAHGQFYGSGGCSSCGVPSAPPVAASCTPIQPVYSACYETVPVTTYTREKQSVQVPYYETAYEDRQITVYKPVTEQRTVEVPTVNYQTVVENRTVNRDMGRWQTNYFPVSKCSPCQVDPRPGVIGWLNRSGYAFRNAFTPSYKTTQTYVPRMVTCNVPVTRQVAVRSTRKVVLNETRMVAETKTERVPVQKLAYRTEERTVMKPQTAWTTVPIGSRLAYGYGGYYGGGTSTAWIIDDTTQTARRPSPDPISGSSPQSAQAPFEADAPRSGDRTFQRSDSDTNKFRRSSFEQPAAPASEAPLMQTPRTFPGEPAAPDFKSFDSGRNESRPSLEGPGSYTSTTPPAAAGGWRVSRRAAADRDSGTVGSVAIPGLSMNDSSRD